jgi:hypothetical protein
MFFRRTCCISIGSLAVLISLCPQVQAQLSIPDARTVGAYPLTMDKVEKKYQATIEITRLANSDAALYRALQNVPKERSLDAQIHSMEAVPQAVKIIQSHGLSVRDYALITVALGMAMYPQMPQSMRSGNATDDPVQIAAPPDHVKLVQEHRQEIEQYIAQIAAASKHGPN